MTDPRDPDERRRLDDLARLYGIQRTYHDAFGHRRSASSETVLALLGSLGASIGESAGNLDVDDAIDERLDALAHRPVEPVAVAWEGRLDLPIRPTTAGDAGEHPVDCELELEDGESRRWRLTPDPPRAADDGSSRVLRLPEALPFGYHRLLLRLGARSTGRGGAATRTEVLVISAPRRAYQGERPAGETAADWGVFLPLYALHAERSWGVGDLADLARLGRWTAGRGGRVVGTLPLFASFLGAGREPFEPSPYAPASRLFWNELYLDPEAAPELARSREARKLLESTALRETLASLRRSDTVDYREAMAAKRPVLEALAQAAFGGNLPEAAFEPGRGDSDLHRFVGERPSLREYAAFRARTERDGPFRGWQGDEPAAVGHGDQIGAVDPEVERYHLYVQWLAEGQLRRAAEACRPVAAAPDGGGGGLYLDLPLGVHPDSYDLWRHRHLFAEGAEAGAPPDPLFAGGQRWGFAPFHPERQRAEGYTHLRQMLGTAMAPAAVLRIDHVMGLHRLYWVPGGRPATDGAYVRYPAEELYAILTLESHRHRTILVGENLGTVPAFVDQSLGRHGIERMYVAQFALQADAKTALAPVPDDVLACLDTHDTPTFPAFLEGLDIERRLEEGLLDPDREEDERDGRQAVREALVEHLADRGLLPLDAVRTGADPVAVSRAALERLAESPSPLLLVNLEDLWGETQPQNVPGTGAERPNWRRKAAWGLERIEADPDIATALERIAARRARAARGEATPAARPATEPAGAVITGEALGVASPITDDDLYLFNEGRHFRLYETLGARPMEIGGEAGVYFAVWAPSASLVSVMGDFDGWRPGAHPLSVTARGGGASGIWEGFVPGVEPGSLYKYHVVSGDGCHQVEKADPFAFQAEESPRTGSVVADLGYRWGDGEWMAERAAANGLDAPISIYELHLGSWRRKPEEGDRPLTYREIAPKLAAHVKRLGFTHVELLPVMEHPFYGSWGYQTTGYFAPTSRYGTPRDFMALVDHLHQEGIGVILDWVPSHFATDEHGLARFDGTHLFEHADPRQGFHPDWGSLIFNYGRHEVRSFLISSALFWLERYHVDGIRVDAVASMLYLDYSREEGEWIPNQYGGRENLEALSFLRQLNEEVYRSFPDVQTFAEESTAWPMVSRPTYLGGLGFGLKWDMGWMHDTLQYMEREPIHRKYHHGDLTFRMVYAFSENFCLPLSHDEVVHGKGSLLAKMPGPNWEKLANLRLLYGYMSAQPGKKLLFMGAELGQWREWSHEASLDWHLLDHAPHAGLLRLVADLNRVYRSEPALHELDVEPEGFEWLEANDAEASVLAFLRKGKGQHGQRGDLVACVFNFTPVVRHNYRLGVPRGGRWQEIVNTDAEAYWGSGQGNLGGVEASPVRAHGRSHSLNLTLPPLAAVFLKSPGEPS